MLGQLHPVLSLIVTCKYLFKLLRQKVGLISPNISHWCLVYADHTVLSPVRGERKVPTENNSFIFNLAPQTGGQE